MFEDRNHLERVPSVSTTAVPQNSQLEEGGAYAALNGYGYGYPKSNVVSRLMEWKRIILRHKLLIVSIVAIVVPFVTIEAYRAKPVYQATATIEVQKAQPGMVKDGDFLMYADPNNTKSEAFILRSRPVIESAVRTLGLERNPMFTEAPRRTAFEAIAALTGSDTDRTAENQAAAGVTFATEPLPEKEELERVEGVVNAVTSGVKVESIRDTQLLNVSYVHVNPEIAQSIANGVALSFANHNYKTKTERFADTSGWLEDSTRKLKAQVEMAERKLADYSRANNIYSLEGKESLTSDKLVRLHDQVMRAETDRILKASLFEEVRRGRVAQLPEAIADPKTAELRKSLNDLAVNASQLSVRFGARNPKLLEIKQQMSTLQDQINSNQSMLEEKLRADYDRAIREEGSLKSALNQAKAEAVQQNQAAIQYSILQQDLTTAKSLYTDFLNKTSQAQVQRAEVYNNVRVIQSAQTPRTPIGSKRSMIVLMGLLVSLGIGVGAAYLLEHANTAVRTVDDVKRLTQLPTLAVIPHLNSAESITPGRKKKAELGPGQKGPGRLKQPAQPAVSPLTKTGFSAGSEAYRMLRTTVMLSTAGRPPKTMLFTSGEPGDGKTTTIYNTAIAFTQLNAKVIIVDCDMRKPKVHKMASIQRSKQFGISTWLSGYGSLKDMIQPTGIPNLSVLPCGPIPPNPSELISSQQMKELLVTLSKHFDFILVDSPPVVTVTDPIILSTLVDGVIVVTKSGKSKGEMIRRACQELQTVGSKVLGVVLNDFNQQEEGYDNYMYYRYNYNYSEGGKEPRNRKLL
ncbi:MAG: polysaccharide biosynthesis tyrosine autokinase [Blastocatellia bacterium]|nr:polysaccharide biosynthesis tyrosine autokinase [Blastocatellia bacterium]